MKARLLRTLRAAGSADPSIVTEEDGVRYITEGTIIDHPDCYRLVHGGHAEAVDDECREAVEECDPASRGEMRRKHDSIMKKHQEAQEEQLNDLLESEMEDEDE